MSPQVLTERRHRIGIITLNRSEKLNALTMEMYEGLDSALQEWEHDAAISAMVIRANGERAFCAGGDVSVVYNNGPKKQLESLHFFATEYAMNARIFHCKKPYIALLHGMVMGGGMGVSMHGSHIIVDPNTVMAMPETAIGFFPDVGGSYFLSRAPGELGTYFGLTGARMNANDAHFCGFAHFLVERKHYDSLINLLANSDLAINESIEQYATSFSPSALTEQQSIIDRCFAFNSIEEIFYSLEQNASSFAQQTLTTLQKKSPTSLKITLLQLRTAKQLSFDECMAMELRLVKMFLQGHDFYEGIRAAVIEKDNQPRWQPDTLAEVDITDIAKIIYKFSKYRDK